MPGLRDGISRRFNRNMFVHDYRARKAREQRLRELSKLSCSELERKVRCNENSSEEHESASVVGLLQVFNHAVALSGFPQQTTQYDINEHLLPVFDELADKILSGAIEGYVYDSSKNKEPWDWKRPLYFKRQNKYDFYVWSDDILRVMNNHTLPSGGENGIIVRSVEMNGMKNPDGRKEGLNFRKNMLLALGEANEFLPYVCEKELKRYTPMMPEEFKAYIDRSVERRRSVRGSYKYYPWAEQFWARLGINEDPGTKNRKPPAFKN